MILFLLIGFAPLCFMCVAGVCIIFIKFYNMITWTLYKRNITSLEDKEK